jgi:hypothetical protein
VYIFDLPYLDAYILRLWYLVYSQIWTNLLMIITNGSVTKLQKEKHCSILYANQGFFFFQVVIWRIWRFFPKLFSKIIWIYTRKTNFSKFFWICFSKKMFKNAVQSLKLHNVGPFILWIYKIMNHTPCQNERISVQNGINKQYSWKKKYNKDPQKDQAVRLVNQILVDP